ncbi:MAG TPA: thiol:disulfide interchange protein DsbA/DsbL [Gammaproteobacteria bacterium]|jgi:thiol:disulfide interchange protein DsbA|nr:thiol:disulfide interchange protein DsbA/DsbL [Gammaproteobacteria bacterium]
MRYTKIVIAACLAVCAWGFTGIASAEGMTTFTEGVNYVPVSPAQPTTVNPGQIEVIEFFWYGCPHCFALEPYLESWLKHKPANVVFKRIPGALPGSEWLVSAQAYYTAQALGLEPRINTPMFDAIHVHQQYQLAQNQAALQEFFAKYGVSKKDFDATWNSFSVQLKMNQAADIEQRYGLEGVPTVIVNGKWKTGAGYKMAPSDIMKCIEFLVQKEEAASGKK